MTDPTSEPVHDAGDDRELFRLAFEHAPIGIALVDPDGTIRWVNDAACSILRRHREDLCGASYQEIVLSADLDGEGEVLAQVLASGASSYTVERRCWRGDGEVVPLQIDVSLVFDDDGAMQAYLAHLQDITERRRTIDDLARAHDEIQVRERRFAALVERSTDLICVVGADGAITYFSPAAAHLFGDASREWLGRSFVRLVHPEDRPGVLAAFEDLLVRPGATVTSEVRMLNVAGEWRHTEIVATNRLEDPAVGGVVANVRDVTDRAEAAAKLAFQAFHDPLTGLPNRALLNDRLAQALARSRRSGQAPAVAFLDLDRFKVVNDSLGHGAGDRLLVEVARRLLATVREQDTVARLGGDEFVVLVEEATRDDVLALAARLTRVVAEPIDLPEGTVNTSTSIGVAFASTHTVALELLRDADTALYRAKEMGRNRVHVFTDSLRAAALRRAEVDQGLRRALAEDRLQVHFQPIVDLTTGEVVVAEALLRVEGLSGELELPGEFLSVADDSGLIVELGRRVLDRACAALTSWRATLGELAPQRVAVNVFGRELAAADFAANVDEVLARHGLEPTDLALEFSEATMLGADRETLRMVERLRAAGICLTVDDFGTGYSSLAYLKRFPIGAVKLERTFIAGLGEDASDAEIVRAVVSLGDALELDVVAEGVETAVQLQLLQELGCSYGQGFLLGAPVPASGLAPSAVAAVIGATSAGWAVAGG